MRPLTAKDGSDPTPAALPWAATQGKAPLTGRRFIHDRVLQGWVSEALPINDLR